MPYHAFNGRMFSLILIAVVLSIYPGGVFEVWPQLAERFSPSDLSLGVIGNVGELTEITWNLPGVLIPACLSLGVPASARLRTWMFCSSVNRLLPYRPTELSEHTDAIFMFAMWGACDIIAAYAEPRSAATTKRTASRPAPQRRRAVRGCIDPSIRFHPLLFTSFRGEVI